MNNIRLPTGAGGRPKTPARPLYAARLPPIHHPLGAPASPRPGSPEEAAPKMHMSASEPVISMPQIPKMRPTTGRPAGTMMSATSTMGHNGSSAKPLPAIAEPSRRSTPNDKNTPPAKVALKCAVIIVFLSIPILIFILMMVMSGGFEPTPLENFANEMNPNATTMSPDATETTLRLLSGGDQVNSLPTTPSNPSVQQTSPTPQPGQTEAVQPTAPPPQVQQGQQGQQVQQGQDGAPPTPPNPNPEPILPPPDYEHEEDHQEESREQDRSSDRSDHDDGSHEDHEEYISEDKRRRREIRPRRTSPP